MSKHNSQSSGNVPPTKNEMSEGRVPESADLAQDLEAGGSAQRMSTEIKIGLGTLGFLLIVLVGVLIYRVWQMKAGDGIPQSGEKAATVAQSQEPAEEAKDALDPSSSSAAFPESTATDSKSAASTWNVDYSNETGGPSLAVSAPAWPAEMPSAPTSANAGSTWAEVGIGQTMLPEPPNNHGSADRSSLGIRSPDFGPAGEVVSDANSRGMSDIREGDDAMGNIPSAHASNSPPSDIPFGPWNAAATSSGEIEAASSSAASDAPPATPFRSSSDPAAPDFFAGGMPITRNDTALPQEEPTSANAPIDDGSFSAPNATPADLSTREGLAPLGEAGIAAAIPPFGQGGVSSPHSVAAGGESASNAASQLAVAEPGRPVGSPSWGGAPPQVPPLAAGNAPGTAAVNGKTYTVQEGETLFDIARRQLGKASRWVEIYDLNRTRLGKQMEGFRPGITLILPQAESAATAPSPQVLR